MKRVPINTLPGAIGRTVKVTAWAHRVRNQKRMQFVVLRDRTGFVQAVHERKGDNDRIGEAIDQLTEESTVEVVGQVVGNDIVKLGQIELVVSSLDVTSHALAQKPVTSNTGIDTRLDWRFLDLRRPENRLIFEMQTIVESAMRAYWKREDFIEMHSPKLMGSASESGAELFQVDYFGGNAYLAQSPQFYKQMAMASGFERVFEIGPVFRANPSFTSRHDTEFTSVDVEIAWVDSHEEIMEFEERWLQFVLRNICDECGNRIKETYGIEVVVPEVPFPRIPLQKAHDILGAEDDTVADNGDLNPKGERLLSQYVKERYGHEFVFVVDYPASKAT